MGCPIGGLIRFLPLCTGKILAWFYCCFFLICLMHRMENLHMCTMQPVKIAVVHHKSGETLTQVVQRSCGCPIPGGVQQ